MEFYYAVLNESQLENAAITVHIIETISDCMMQSVSYPVLDIIEQFLDHKIISNFEHFK